MWMWSSLRLQMVPKSDVLMGAVGINVPRSEILTVEKTSDLLLLRSDLYSLHGGNLEMNAQLALPGPLLIKLSNTSFSRAREVDGSFSSIPDISDR